MKKYILILSAMFFSYSSWGQSYVDATGAARIFSTRALEDFNNLKNVIEEDKTVIENIKGSMYYNNIFQKSTIYFKGNPIREKALLRYNSYKDEIEIGKSSNQNKASSILTKNLKVEAQIGNQLFKVFSLNQKKKQELNYLIEIYSDNKIKLYLRKSKKFIDQKFAPSAIGGFLSARFDDKIQIFYNTFESIVPKELKINKRSIINLFPNKEAQLKSFISRKKIKFKDYNDVLFVFENFISK